MAMRGVFQTGELWVAEDPGFRDRLRAAGVRGIPELSSRWQGEVVTNHRSSWVRRWSDSAGSMFVKTYEYTTWRDRMRGAGRTTWLAPSRVAREAKALAWLREHGFGGPQTRAAVEFRVAGWLTRAVLVTDAWPGQSIETLWPTLTPDDRGTLVAAVRALVDRLHLAGFRDRNLDARNLLARRDEGAWTVVKIDSPRFRLVRPGPATDRRATADLQRLSRSLTDLGWPVGND
ncbi:MAG: hypothetical protein H6836_09230 [Planctomycetes bacterium]|nr:hypothetical protein [Planctomycetota bacterium]